ncbi:MAG: outer membrane beta-barrel protein [Gammaproteobacteria bacterium]|nr:outer membrane beta-barrel protein [Gammaproteobacteria bacterium]
MKNLLVYTSISLLLTTLTFANIAYAEEPYAGFSLGQTKVGDFCDDFSGIPGVSCEDTDTSFKVFGGAKINKNFAVEGSYIDFGELIAKDNFIAFTAEITGFNISALGVIPASDSVDLFGKVGMLFWDLKLALSGVFNDSLSESGNDFAFGFGANFDVNETFSIRAEFEKFQTIGKESTTGESSVSLISLGAVFYF